MNLKVGFIGAAINFVAMAILSLFLYATCRNEFSIAAAWLVPAWIVSTFPVNFLVFATGLSFPWILAFLPFNAAFWGVIAVWLWRRFVELENRPDWWRD